MVDTTGITISALAILAAFTLFSYRSFRNEQKARLQFALTHAKPWRSRRRELELGYGNRAKKTIKAIRPVLLAYGNLLRLSSRRGFLTWLIGKPLTRWEAGMARLEAAVQAYDAAYTELLSQPIGRDDDDE